MATAYQLPDSPAPGAARDAVETAATNHPLGHQTFEAASPPPIRLSLADEFAHSSLADRGRTWLRYAHEDHVVDPELTNEEMDAWAAKMEAAVVSVTESRAGTPADVSLKLKIALGSMARITVHDDSFSLEQGFAPTSVIEDLLLSTIADVELIVQEERRRAENDARIAAAFERFRGAFAMNADTTEEEEARFTVMDPAESEVCDTPALTPRGAALKIRALFPRIFQEDYCDDAAIDPGSERFREGLDEADWGMQKLWALHNDLVRMDENDQLEQALTARGTPVVQAANQLAAILTEATRLEEAQVKHADAGSTVNSVLESGYKAAVSQFDPMRHRILMMLPETLTDVLIMASSAWILAEHAAAGGTPNREDPVCLSLALNAITSFLAGRRGDVDMTAVPPELQEEIGYAVKASHVIGRALGGLDNG